MCDRKGAIYLIYRGIFLLSQTNPTSNLYGLVNLTEVGMFVINQPKIGFRHLFLMLIHCFLRGTCRWFCIDGSIVNYSSYYLPRYWTDFPYETESISIRDGGTAPRTFTAPPTPKKKSKKPPVVIVGLIHLFNIIDANPPPFSRF